MRNHALLGGACVATLLIAGCVSAPQQADPGALSYRLVVDNGMALVGGHVKAPAQLVVQGAGPAATANAALVEIALPGAKVELVNAAGEVPSGRSPTLTDAGGSFLVRGLPVGEAGFLRASFTALDGVERHLYSYVRPDTPNGCQEITLASTLLAAKVAQAGTRYSLFEPGKLGPLASRVRDELPALLAGAAGEAVLTPEEQALVDEILKLLTSDNAPAAAAAFAMPHGKSIFDGLFERDPVLKAALQEAAASSIAVTFEIKSLGRNEANIPVAADERYLMMGNAEVRLQAPEALQAVSFWLDNTRMADGQFQADAWAARIDTTKLADGPHMLSAVAHFKQAAPPGISRAFVLLRNASAPAALTCLGS
ncbi:MAG: hypothetical protein JWM80_5539 [Cyanobacteria bacterium RYN_339]|nr:hypothetical protein [Cyanobacteria bacterium RYN_339]